MRIGNSVFLQWFDFGGYREGGPIGTILFDAVTALVFFSLALPAFLLIALVIRLVDGAPVFYVGERLGFGKRPYKMYKFRTLNTGSQSLLQDRVLSSADRFETRTGKFLRESRLDELPQLINVIKGEMRLVGPRPERPEIYENLCKGIPGYDVRFEVKPGLIGYSQIFTPHNAPKRMRTLIDNYYVRCKQKWYTDIFFFFYALAMLAKRALIKGSRLLRQRMRRMWHHQAEEVRRYERIEPSPTRAIMEITGEQGDSRQVELGDIADINDEAFSLETRVTLPEHPFPAILSTTVPGSRGFGKSAVRHKQVRIQAHVFRCTSVAGQEMGEFQKYILRFIPASPLNALVLHKYILDKSIL
ncbi:MAG: sugar transferase [Magnetococcales bacterium]|nr:sugar transferase [Magnetococcales bacterium]